MEQKGLPRKTWAWALITKSWARCLLSCLSVFVSRVGSLDLVTFKGLFYNLCFYTFICGRIYIISITQFISSPIPREKSLKFHVMSLIEQYFIKCIFTELFNELRIFFNLFWHKVSKNISHLRFPVVMLKYAGKRHLKEKGFTLAHSFRKLNT